MKKSFFAFFAAAVSLLASCSQEQNVETTVPNGKNHITILADIIPTKTTVTDEGIYSWSANETIGVVEQDGSEVLTFSIEDAENGLFSGDLTVGKDPVFAVSPAAFVSGVAEVDGDIEYDIILDNIDNYIPGTTNAIMVAEYSGKDGDNYKFHFNHVAALVKVPVENVPVGTAKVKLTLDKNITGFWPGLDTTTPTLSEDTDLGEPSLTLTLKKAVTNPNTSADYYFPVPCNNYTSFQFELLNASSERIKGMKKTGLNITLGAADLFMTPTITLDPVEITKGAEWTYTFVEKEYSKNETITLTDAESVAMDWTLDGTFKNSDGYWAYDETKGQQFGSGSKPYSSLTLTADSGVNGIKDVIINTSGASSINATVSVSVGGTAFVIKGSDPAKTSESLTAISTEYSFTSPDGNLYAGDIVISYSNSSSKAIYLKSISLNPDKRTDPELAYSPASYSVVVSSSFDTPALSAVDGFDGTVTYAIGGEDDPEVASVNAETGAVTIGAKTGTVTVTATFAGNATYKPDSASYTITVGAAALSVSTNSPAAAECNEGATATFTVTSNVEWSATTTDDGTIITGISPLGVQSPSADPVTVTVTFAANSGAQRTATVNVKPSNQTLYSDLNRTVTMTQMRHTVDVIFEKYSGVLTAGTYLLVDADSYVAMRSKISNDRANYWDVEEYENGKIKNPIPSIVWEIAASGDYWTIYSDTTSTYIAGTGVKNKAQLIDAVSDYSEWSVSSTAQSTTYSFVNKNNAAQSVNANLRYNSGVGFACYANGTVTLYKLQDKREDAGMSWSAASAKATYNTGNDLSFTPLTLDVGNATAITYESSDETIATINETTGLITITALTDNTVKEGSTIIKAIFEGNEDFKPQTVSYTITVEDSRDAATTPTLDPVAGEVEYGQVVTFQPADQGLTFHYTVDGSNPTVESSTGASITIDATKTVKVIATKTGYKPSSIVSAAYTPTYSLTWMAPSNGTMTVKRGDVSLTSGNSVPADAIINVTATPNSGYALSTLVYNDGSDHDIKASKTFTMPAHAVSITATFEEKGSGPMDLEAPESISITDINLAGKKFSGSWNAVADASSYDWVISTASTAGDIADGNTKASGNTTDTSFNTTALGDSYEPVSGVVYYLYVRSVGDGVSFATSDYGQAHAIIYQHIFTKKPSTGNNITLSNISWTIAATNLNNYNSANYAGVQFGTSSKNGSISLTSTSAWGGQSSNDYYGYGTVKKVNVWANRGGTSVTPSVTIGGTNATGSGSVVKNSYAGSDWTKTSKVVFTPGTNAQSQVVNTGVVYINLSSVNAGYICAVEILSE